MRYKYITDFDSATTYLSQFVERLAAGSVTGDEFNDAVTDVLVLLFDQGAEDQLEAIHASWGSNQARPVGTSGGLGESTQFRPEDEEILRQQARTPLAAAEQRQDNNRDAMLSHSRGHREGLYRRYTQKVSVWVGF
ncbi:hypothetical protein RSOL_230320, partial [Rhizoctonia solani AG-3 Rhs1AP]